MRIVRPYAVQDADLTTNATESVAAWSSVTSYTTGQEAAYGRRVYEAIQNGSNKQPDTNPLYWFDKRPTNPWAMFDNKTGTQTTRTSPLEVTVDVEGFADTIGLLNVDAAMVNVKVMEGMVEVYNQDHQMTDESAVVDYYEYFFEPIIRKTDLVVSGLPDTLDPSITVTLTDTTDVAIGHMVMGQSRYIGGVQYGASIGIVDFSKIEEDEFGNTFIVERSFNRRGRFAVWVPAGSVDATYNLVSSYRATPVMVIAAEEYASTFYFGLLREAEIEISYPTYSKMSLEVRGL